MKDVLYSRYSLFSTFLKAGPVYYVRIYEDVQEGLYGEVVLEQAQTVSVSFEAAIKLLDSQELQKFVKRYPAFIPEVTCALL